MEVGFSVGEGDLEVGLVEGGGCGEGGGGGGVDFADEDWWAVGGAGEGFEGHDFRGDGCGEEAGLAVGGGGEGDEAGFDVWEHAAWAGGEEAVCFVKDDDFGPSQADHGVLAGCLDVVCQSARGCNDDVRPLRERQSLGTHF